MKRIAGILAILVTLSGLLAAPAQARGGRAAIVVKDDHGTTITLAAPARRIISLAPNVTEMLFALDLGHDVVAVSSYSTYPAAAAKLPVVITYTSVKLEKILSLKPDLLVAASIVPQATIARLRGLHLTVLVADPHSLAGILHDIRIIGTAAGVSHTANALDARLQGRINDVEAAVRHATTHPRVFYEIDNTGYTAGHGSFIDALIGMAGGVNVAGRIMNPYPQLSKEKLIALNPQVILLGDANYGVTPASVAARPGWSVISAVKLHHVYSFNDDLVSRPGPRIVDGLEIMARRIHPELFH